MSEATANTAVLNWADITTRLLMDNDVPMSHGLHSRTLLNGTRGNLVKIC